MSESADLATLATGLGEVRRQLAGEVKLRQAIIKPLDQAQRALKDPHKNAVELHEATALLENAPQEVPVPTTYDKLVKELRTLADEQLSELEFTFARDLREAFTSLGIELEGPPHEMIAELFVIRPDLRKKQVGITFSRQPVTKGAVKLNVEKVVSAYQKARKDICERKVDYDELLGELFEAYQRVLKLTDKSPGARVSIVQCYLELVLVRQPLGFRKDPNKSKFVDYPKTHFAYDLLELRRQQKLSYQDHRLNLGTATIDVTSDSTKAMYLATGANEGQFIKDLYFTN
ncbi:MAG TPA: hypothetical protein VEF04_18330 [Blastocatellia bacterium]|nr:hypothetical protein [Blastocatellia bacterium]